MDRRLLECTLEVAAAIGALSAQQLRVALDRRPWWGAGRVEDPDNMLGHALRKSVGVLARQQGWELPEGACEAGIACRESRLNAALDLDGDARRARQQALTMILDLCVPLTTSSPPIPRRWRPTSVCSPAWPWRPKYLSKTSPRHPLVRHPCGRGLRRSAGSWMATSATCGAIGIVNGSSPWGARPPPRPRPV
jgi:hypothetical protein